MNPANRHDRMSSMGTWTCVLLAVVGGVTLAAGLILHPSRTWTDVLIASNYLTGLGLAGLIMVALHDVTGARWSTPILRIPMAITAVLPLAAIGMLGVLALGGSLYGWTTADTGHRYESPLHHFWLSHPFFLIRAILYFIVWLAFAVAMVRRFRQRDPEELAPPRGNRLLLSALFLVVFGITFWMASCDWLMSLDPEWSSTIFAVYNFAGIILSGFAAVTLLVLGLGHQDPSHGGSNRQVLNDLGAITFGLSCFWMYTWFCQYMLIWYVNNPEETAYYTRRMHGDWPSVALLNLALNWGVPFVVLLFRSAKRSPLILGSVAVLILIGRAVDLFVMIQPTQRAEVPMPGWVEIGLIVGSLGFCAILFYWGLRQISWAQSRPR